MTIKEAIENIDSRRPFPDEQYPYVEEDIEAINMAIAALEKQEGKKAFPDSDKSILACQYCGSGEYLHNADENINQYCGQCGQKIDWMKGE